MASLHFAGSAMPSIRPRRGCGSPSLFSGPAFQMPDGRGSFFDVLTGARQRGLEVRVLFWRPDDATAHLRTNAFWGSPAHVALLEQQASDISVRWDRAHPGFCQHQKLWLIDAGLDTACAFVGSINLNPHSVVAPGHRGAEHNHDMYLEISGPAVTDIHHNFVQRWNEASERHAADGRWGPDADRDLAFPDRVAAACGPPSPRCSGRSILAATPTPTPPRRGSVCHRRR